MTVWWIGALAGAVIAGLWFFPGGPRGLPLGLDRRGLARLGYVRSGEGWLRALHGAQVRFVVHGDHAAWRRVPEAAQPAPEVRSAWAALWPGEVVTDGDGVRLLLPTAAVTERTHTEAAAILQAFSRGRPPSPGPG